MKSHAPRGRPREFDRDEVLDRALEAFWQWGYEATSITQLTRVMGINPPSLYAAFGSKEGLFLEALDRYLMTTSGLALESTPTARQAVERLLLDASREFTAIPKRRGCFVLCGAANLAEGSERIARLLRERRKASEAAIAKRIERGIREGELAAEVNPRELGKFYASVFQGMSVQARDGASRACLESVARLALLAWPAGVERDRGERR